LVKRAKFSFQKIKLDPRGDQLKEKSAGYAKGVDNLGLGENAKSVMPAGKKRKGKSPQKLCVKATVFWVQRKQARTVNKLRGGGMYPNAKKG